MTNEKIFKSVNLLGVNVSDISISDAVEYSITCVKSRKGGQVVTINPEMFKTVKSSKHFKQIVDNASLVLPDGVGVKLGLKLKNINIHRVAGIEYAYNMLVSCAENKIPVALVGAKPHVVSSAVKNLKEQIPNLNVVYYHNGYFSDEERVIKELKRSVPKFVLVALGSPRQELFIENARKLIPTAVMVGVGGSFDVWSGNVKRAPKFYQKVGLEWLYRTIKEPSRFKRIFPTLPQFMFRVLKEDVLKMK